MKEKLLALYHQHKLISLCAIGVVVLIPVGLIIKGRTAQTTYLTATVTKGAITATVQATGTVNPLTTVPVGSFVSGTVQYIFADFNTRVHAGQVLAQLDPTLYNAQVTTAEGNLNNAKANLNNLLATVDVMKADVQKYQADVTYQAASADRINQLYQQGVFSKDQFDSNSPRSVKRKRVSSPARRRSSRLSPRFSRRARRSNPCRASSK